MSGSDRRYDIDWLRVIAIALLLIFHIALVFQPWGKSGGYIQNEDQIIGMAAKSILDSYL